MNPGKARDNRQRNRRWLSQQLRSAGGAHIGAMVAGTVNGLAIIGQMGVMAWLVHAAIMQQMPLVNLFAWVMGLIAILGLRAITQAMQETRGHLASQRIRQQVRQQLMQRWAALGPVHLASDSHAGVASQMIEQVEALDGYYARYLPQMVICVLVPLAILITVFWHDWLAAIFLLLSAPLIPVFMALVGMGAEKLNQEHFVLVKRLAGHFIDRVRGITTLQLFGQAENASQQVVNAADQYRRLNIKTLRVAFLSSAVLEFFASVAIAVVAIYIGFGLLGYIDYGPSPQLTLFSGLFVLLLAPEFFQPLRQLAQHYHDRSAALGAADSLVTFLAEDEPDSQPTAPASPAPTNGNIVRVQQLSVHFPGRGKVLSDINLTVRRGEIVVLAGPSGAGKSTLLHALAGFVTPSQGAVTVNGLAPGKQPIGWMDQRPFLLFGTWADNLLLTAPDASDHDLHRAIDHAGLSNVLAQQPEGLATPLGEQGRGLSGGQARRLALSRIFLARVDLVLLDEPTTGLDSESEQAVITGLKQLAQDGHTLIMATHHPALMAAADRVVRLERGRLHAET